MTATFDPALADEISKVRLKIGDTDPTRAQVQDETILSLIEGGKSIIAAARELCLFLAAKWASAGDVTIDDQMQRASNIYKHYMDLADRLAKEENPNVSSAALDPFASLVGGTSDARGPLQDHSASCYDEFIFS